MERTQDGLDMGCNSGGERANEHFYGAPRARVCVCVCVQMAECPLQYHLHSVKINYFVNEAT